MTNPTGSSSPDFYSVLGVDPDADQKTIRAAYRRRMRQTHPDQGGSAEEFHRVQQAWEALGSEESRSAYDRARGGVDPAGPTAEEDFGLNGGTYARGRTWTASTSGTAHSPGGRRGGPPKPSGAALRPPVYEPDLSTPEPLSLPLTSQRVHGQFASRGLFGGGKTQRRHRRSVELLTKHVLEELPAARLFNDVHLEPAAADRKGRRRAPRGSERAEHVLVCGDALVVLGVHEVAASAASWDGRTLRAGGRAMALPNLAAQARRLRETLTQRLAAEYGREPVLTISHQMMLLSTDGSLLSPVVEPAAGSAPLAAGRAVRRVLAELAVSERANVVDRRLLAALRDQLATPDVV
ncbi:DnaJ domain-containing protein [Nesterenkonia lacusekhoensis]|uniref:Curved DNA-binding protein CbpA n=1 Tax=Nesterenkonia lacusekhoensis TaxID=150832 RepID=A0ABS4T2J7_9MICC|nr:J domain-containing protein [Nesterenkonia lacusekhoensis]MBP2318655.1 curved DNA-binding protein CbpA [Nesterenkonia lacusekhoensis]